MKSSHLLRTTLSVGLLAGELLPNVGNAAAAAPLLPSTIEQNTTEVAFAAIREAWTIKGVGLMATRLVMLGSGQYPTCPDRAMDEGDVISPAYCPTNNTFFMTPSMMTYILDKKIPPIPALQVVTGHEMGHAIQAATSQDDSRLPYKNIEDQADCYAGEIEARLYPANVVPGSKFFDSLRGMDDPDHGTPEERLHYYFQGALTGVCNVP